VVWQKALKQQKKQTCSLSHCRVTIQLNYNFTIPCMNLHGSPQCHWWLLLRGIRVPRYTYFTWMWNHAIILCIMVKPCIWSTQLPWNPNCVRVRFVRQQFSLTLEKGDPSGRVEGSKWCRKNRNYTCIAETCVLYSDCELKRDSSTTIRQNHVKSLGKTCNHWT